uniref:TIR domain-containing protein n=1 Tax=Rhabditophanes sp. KR3021 TaxID=114890 RepID=A0AC35TQ66_9BILA
MILSKILFIKQTLLVLFIYILLGTTSSYSAVASIHEYRYNCPQRCICIPDAMENERLTITCKWEMIRDEYIDTLPANVTKSLTINCNKDYIQVNNGNEEGRNPVYSSQYLRGARKGPLESLIKLRDLRITGCSLLSEDKTTLMPHLLIGLNSLRNLYLDKVGSTSNDISLPSAFLKPASQLEKFSLTQSGISSLASQELCLTDRLQILNVSHNALTDPSLGTEGCLSLKHLAILDMSGNLLSLLSNQDFASFFAIQQLTLSRNRIGHIDRYVFKNVPLLQHLEMHSNKIDDIPELPEKLLHLNVAGNELDKLPFSIGNLRQIISLNMSSNSIGDGVRDRYGVSLKGQSIENLDISGNKFNKIPFEMFAESFGAIQMLDLARNNIRVLNSFGNMSRVQSIDLSQNKIEELKGNPISKLTHLEDFNLSNNTIHKIELEFFEAQANSLTSLDLTNNLLLDFPLAITPLSKIKQIKVGGNEISTIRPFTLSKLSLLSHLDVSGNRLSSIDSFVYSDCSKLKRLCLANNRIISIVKDAFNGNNQLTFLDLSGNHLVGFGEDGGAIEGIKSLKVFNFSNNLLESLNWHEVGVNLIELDVSSNRVVMISTLKHQKYGIKRLNLMNNRLLGINSQSIPNNVEYLNLGKNLIKFIQPNTFVKLPALKHLDLRGNQISEIEESAFLGTEEDNRQHMLGSLKLYLAENPLKCSCKEDWMLKYLIEVPEGIDTNLYYIQQSIQIRIMDADVAACFSGPTSHSILLKHIRPEDLLCQYQASCGANCVCCDYGNCDCHSKCPDGCQCFHSNDYSTNVVTCKATNDSRLRGFTPRDVPMHATHVYLKNMMLPVIRSHDFLARLRLKSLSITDSGVKKIEKNAFNTLMNLETLDLSNNWLEDFDSEVIPKAHKLKQLILANNKLERIDPKLGSTLPSLNELSLEHNKLTHLPIILNDLVMSNRLQRTSISGNEFRCDCHDRFQMQYWLLANQLFVSDHEAVNCVENVTNAFKTNDTTILSSYQPNSGSHLYEISMLKFMTEANKSICVTHPVGFFGGIFVFDSQLLVVVLVILGAGITISVCCMCYSLCTKSQRAHTQKGYKKGVCSMNCSTNSPQSGCSPLPPSTLLWSQAQGLLNFDIFVSYAKNDEQTVLKKLCGPLEDDEYTMALLHRDGPRFNSLVHQVNDELNNLLECSQTLVLLITKAFLANEWKMLQIKTSHQLYVTQTLNKSKRVIAILDEDILLNELDDELGQILRRSTYIRINDPLFWNLFKSALPLRSGFCRMTSPTPLSDTSSSQHYSDLYGTTNSTTAIVPSRFL